MRERIILNSEIAVVNSNFNSPVEAGLFELERLGMSRVLRNKKVKAISTLPSGYDLLIVLKPTPLLPHAKMLLVPIRFFTGEEIILWRVLCFDWTNVIFSSLSFRPLPAPLDSPHFLLSSGVSTWRFREQKHSRTRRKRLHCRLKYKLIWRGVFSYSSL